MADDSDVIDAEYTTTIKSWKAQSIDSEEVADLVIEFDMDAPDDHYATRPGEPPHLSAKFAYRKEADRIVDALAEHLPGGLFDAIFASMCSHTASVLRVPGKG